MTNDELKNNFNLIPERYFIVTTTHDINPFLYNICYMNDFETKSLTIPISKRYTLLEELKNAY